MLVPTARLTYAQVQSELGRVIVRLGTVVPLAHGEHRGLWERFMVGKKLVNLSVDAHSTGCRRLAQVSGSRDEVPTVMYGAALRTVGCRRAFASGTEAAKRSTEAK